MKKLILLATLFVSIFANAQTRDTTYSFDALTYPNQIDILKLTAPIYICDNKNTITMHFRAGDISILSVRALGKNGWKYLVKEAQIIKYMKDTTFIFSLDSFVIQNNGYYYGGNYITSKTVSFQVILMDKSNTKTFVNKYLFAYICTPWTVIESVSDKRVLTTNYINYLGQPTNECRPCIEELIFDDGSRQRKQVSYK